MRTVALALSLCVVCASAAAHAQSPPSAQEMLQARELFRQGATAYDAGHYEQALDLFHRSYALSHEPRLLYNVGLAADRLRRDAEAVTSFQGYLDGVPDAENRDVVVARLRILRDAAAERARVDEAARADLAAREAARRDATAPMPGERHDDGGVLSQWWFWTIVGVVVVGATVGIVVGVTSSGQAPIERAPTAGDDGRIIMTLVAP